MRVDTATGLLDAAQLRVSPHCDPRPAPQTIDLLVLHGISLPPGEFGGPWIDALFAGTLDCTAHPYFAALVGLRVSAHLLIRRDGAVLQYVPFTQRAWHAGASCFEERANCNDFSIGIELEGDDDTPYSDAQYRTLAPVVRSLMHAYPGITPQRIVGHSDIAPGRKTDPGSAFDWARLRALIGSRSRHT
jgi:N-acetyl-anhydromuramoyl-L-alanine amidase